MKFSTISFHKTILTFIYSNGKNADEKNQKWFERPAYFLSVSSLIFILDKRENQYSKNLITNPSPNL